VPAAAAAYALATGAEAVRVGADLGWRHIPAVWAIFPTIHVAHGVGFASGLLRYLRAPDWSSDPERVPARRAHLHAV
jgi:hypothetical protein